MWVLGAMSVLTLTLIIYLFAILRRGQVVPRSLQRVVVEGLRGGAMDDVRRACEYRRCAFSSVVLTALNYLREVPEGNMEMLGEAVRGEGMRQAESLQGQTQFLLDVGVIAPMVGLLGTVLGMLKAFSGVANELVQARPDALAAGVSMALITTACGLIVGIPAMAFYALFRRRAARLVSELEAATSEVLTTLQGRGAA
jgi:biopolymer transport protein ExbB